MSAETQAVAKKTAAAMKLSEHSDMLRALIGGTPAMRAAGEKYLPKWPNEDKKAYDFRLQVSTLFPGYGRTVEILAAKPFSKPLTIGEDVPAQLKELAEDIDLQGRSLHVFSASVCEEVVGYGFAGILVEYPKVEQEFANLEEEKQSGVRPYMVQINVDQVLGWRCERKNGKWRFTQLRLELETTEPDGEYGEKTVKEIRVLMPGAWESFRKNTEGQWVSQGGGNTKPVTEIPFVPVYGRRKGFMISSPPLLELAYLNVKHYQSQSDQDNIMHVARVPILVIMGGDPDKELTVGGSTAMNIPKGGDAKFVEHGGKAIEAGDKSLARLEDEMRQAGAELLVIKPGNTTEVQTMSDNERETCALQRIAGDLEDALDQAMQFMAEFMNQKSGGHVEVYKDFGAASLAEASMEILVKMNATSTLSDETLFAEAQRRNMISSDVIWTEEKARIDAQEPKLPPPGEGLPLPGEDEDDEDGDPKKIDPVVAAIDRIGAKAAA